MLEKINIQKGNNLYLTGIFKRILGHYIYKYLILTNYEK